MEIGIGQLAFLVEGNTFFFFCVCVFVLYIPVVSAFTTLPLSPTAISMLSEVSAYCSAIPRAITRPSASSG